MKLKNMFLPSILDFFAIFVFVLLMIYQNKIMDFDIWWHLKTGELLLKGQFLTKDIFSFTANGYDWVLHEWGSQVILAFMYLKKQLFGLVLYKAILGSIMASFLFRLFIIRGVNIFLSIILSLFAFAFFALNIWTERPHLFSVTFFCILFLIYEKFRKSLNVKILYFLPLLFWAWINLHGGYVIGFVFLGCCIVSEILNHIDSDKSNLLSFSAIKHLIIVFVISVALCFINPFTYKLVFYPYMYVSGELGNFHSFIAEWQYTCYTNKDFIFILFLVMLVLSLNKIKMKFYEIGLLLVFLFWGFTAIRLIVFFAIVSIVLIAPYLEEVIKVFFARNCFKKICAYCSARSNYFLKLENELFNPVKTFILIFILAICFFFLPAQKFFKAEFDNKNFPTKTLDYLKEEAKKSKVILFNEYGWGGLLIFELPEVPVFIDGRQDVYKKYITSDHLRVCNMREGWQEVIKRYGFTHILLKKDRYLVRLLPLIDSSWKVMCTDENSILLVKK